MHPDQLSVTPDLVHRLVVDQFPEWVGLEVRPVASGGAVNAIFRIGEELVARVPLRDRDPVETRSTLVAEAVATAELFGRVPFPSPEPIAIGEPGEGFPLPWAVQTWVPGTTASDDDIGPSMEFASDLATLVRALRAIDTRGRTFAPSTRVFRGGDLTTHNAWMNRCFDESVDLFDVPHLRRLWSGLRKLPREAPDAMCHGDLTPLNVLVANGRLAGIIDCGSFGPADPALDLICAWHLLEAGPRAAFRASLNCSDLEWERGKAWAFEQSMGVAWYYRDTNPALHRMGTTTIARILAETPGS